MQTETILDNVTVFTGPDGALRAFKTNPTNAALNAKTLLLFLDVHEVDNNCKLDITFEHSADGQNWSPISPDIISTGGAASSSTLYTGSESDFGAWVRFDVQVEESTAQSNQLSAQISLKAVWKPF